MKFPLTLTMSVFLSGAVLGVEAANSKLNQYASLEDCQNDKNIISHASPPVYSCHDIDTKTRFVYLVVGSGAAGAGYRSYPKKSCKGDGWPKQLQTGHCVELLPGYQVQSLKFDPPTI